MRDLLKKPWNPYVHRHSALTEKLGLLNSDINLRQFAGWSINSNMHRRYVHLSGGESMKCLLKVKGIVDDEKQINMLESKSCPSCHESNRPDAQFCFKCNSMMSFEAYQKIEEERQKKDQELKDLRQEMSRIASVTYNLSRGFELYKKEFLLYREQFGARTLTEGERKRLKEIKEQLDALPVADDENIDYEDAEQLS
jgi:hypothetical protein